MKPRTCDYCGTENLVWTKNEKGQFYLVFAGTDTRHPCTGLPKPTPKAATWEKLPNGDYRRIK